MKLDLSVSAPRRVTVVAHELRGFRPVGGMGTATTFLALALARMGQSVEILLGINSPESMDPYWKHVYDRAGVRFRPAPHSDEAVQPWQFVHARNIELGLREEAPDVVIAHDFGAPVYTALRLREAGIAFENTLFIVYCHGTRRYVMDVSPNLAPKDLRNLLGVTVHEQASVELADVAVSPSAYLVEWMRQQGWRLPERTLVIPYLSRAAATGESVSKRAWDDSERLETLAFFGRVDEKKGLTLLAAALNALEPELLDGLDLEFVGKTTATWPRERIEGLLSDNTKRALGRVSFEGDLDQHEALERLSGRGTMALMPSLSETFSNTVYECLVHGIPFIASSVGGVPELVAPEDRGRVLFEATREGLEAALRRVLSEGRLPQPARLAFEPSASLEQWAEVIELRPRPRQRGIAERVDVIIVRRESQDAIARCISALERQTYANFGITVAEGTSVEAARQEGLRGGSAPFVLFLDEEDVPDAELLQTLVRAQAASGADVVSCALRIPTEEGVDTLHFFSGEPGGLGALSNGYGTVALIRRAMLNGVESAWPADDDADWSLLVALGASGARIVSIPVPLVTRRARPGSVERNPSDALLVAKELERALPEPLRSTARVVAGIAANSSGESR